MKIFIAKIEDGRYGRRIGFIDNEQIKLSDKKLESALQEAIETKKKLQYLGGGEKNGFYYTQTLSIVPTLANLKEYIEIFLYQYEEGVYGVVP